jgi:hypothetical protein
MSYYGGFVKAILQKGPSVDGFNVGVNGRTIVGLGYGANYHRCGSAALRRIDREKPHLILKDRRQPTNRADQRDSVTETRVAIKPSLRVLTSFN